ncbi:MAG TPA: hypothetical protein VL995_17335 [Cellvibrio sp.]|nr:hypothetical protein [Cellvibrio sp.]
MPRISIYLPGCFLFFFCHSIVAAVLSCKAADGKTIFTDDPLKCGKQPVAEVQVDIPRQTRVNYRYPERLYDRSNSHWSIFIERPENQRDIEVYKKAVARLTKILDMVFTKFPYATHAKLKTVTFYIMRGPKHSLGGEDSILRYAPHNSTRDYSLHDKRWNNAVIIYNSDNFISNSNLTNNMTIVHELGHAWHFLQWTYQDKAIINTWLSSRNSGLYQSVKNIYGQTLKPAYASTNEREYFADLTAIYFVGGDYHPFNKQGLEKYDPKGYSMIETYWLTQNTNSPQR